MNESKIKKFWERNRSLIVFGAMGYFILSTVLAIIFGTLFLYWGDAYYVYGLVLFALAFAWGCVAFALVRVRKKTS